MLLAPNFASKVSCASESGAVEAGRLDEAEPSPTVVAPSGRLRFTAGDTLMPKSASICSGSSEDTRFPSTEVSDFDVPAASAEPDFTALNPKLRRLISFSCHEVNDTTQAFFQSFRCCGNFVGKSISSQQLPGESPRFTNQIDHMLPLSQNFGNRICAAQFYQHICVPDSTLITSLFLRAWPV